MVYERIYDYLSKSVSLWDNEKLYGANGDTYISCCSGGDMWLCNTETDRIEEYNTIFNQCELFENKKHIL